jgi:hypothetical protein
MSKEEERGGVARQELPASADTTLSLVLSRLPVNLWHDHVFLVLSQVAKQRFQPPRLHLYVGIQHDKGLCSSLFDAT